MRVRRLWHLQPRVCHTRKTVDAIGASHSRPERIVASRLTAAARASLACRARVAR